MEEGIESEQISDNFTCAVCLDILYKPIVLVCGHVSCFWCCQHSMHMKSESHCPLCRHPYHHFPAICQSLHFLLKKLYPAAYKRRNIQTLEDEKQSTLGPSPDIDSFEDDSIEDPSSTKEKKLSGCSAGSFTQVSISDALCGACKQLLFRPVVLNCGHVYCEACISIPKEGILKCQVCECRHPSGLPKVCRQFDHFLEEKFSSEYALRRSTIQLNEEQTQTRIDDAGNQVTKISFPTEENFLQWWSVHASRYHNGVGCDMCGLCPIIGDRYQCKDCTEKCGYDLCGDCYNSGSGIPGRFNQKHTSQHCLELIKPAINHNVINRLLSVASRYQSIPANVLSSSLDENGAGAAGPSESASLMREDEQENEGAM